MLGVWRKRVRRHVGFSAVTGYSTPRKLLNLFLNNRSKGHQAAVIALLDK